MEKGMTLEEFKRKVFDMIGERNDRLKSLFSAGNYTNMPEALPKNSRIVTHQGEIIQGKDSLGYWTEVGKEGINLDFKEPRLDAMELEVGSEPNEDDIDFIAIELTEFSFEAGGKTHKGYIDPPYRHRVKCDIDD